MLEEHGLKRVMVQTAAFKQLLPADSLFKVVIDPGTQVVKALPGEFGR
jgi:hypothetical protein